MSSRKHSTLTLIKKGVYFYKIDKDIILIDLFDFRITATRSECLESPEQNVVDRKEIIASIHGGGEQSQDPGEL